MANFDYSDLEGVTLNMEDEDGVVTECDLQFVFEYKGQDYAAFAEIGSETGEFYFFTIDVSATHGDEAELEIEPVEDDNLLEQLVDVLQQIIDEDEDDEPDLDDDEDDGRWDEFIHKTLED